jgi:coenzyme F420-reducing hydrogenase delta subunit
MTKIIAFCCNWCGYSSTNAAGLSKVQYDPNVKIIRAICSARIDPVFVLESLIKGADGVIVLGCPNGECYYDKGNSTTQKRMKYLKKSLEDSGIDPRRLKVEWISAYEGERFAQVINEMMDDLKRIKFEPKKYT